LKAALKKQLFFIFIFIFRVICVCYKKNKTLYYFLSQSSLPETLLENKNKTIREINLKNKLPYLYKMFPIFNNLFLKEFIDKK